MNVFQPRLEARPEPMVLRSVPSDTSTRRRRRRSWSSDNARRRNDRRYESRSSSSNSFDSESQSERNSDEQESSAESTATFESQRSDPNPGTFTTASLEFGSGGQNDGSASKKDQGTSPIRWLPSTRTPQPTGGKLGKIDISERKGWLPSLGPKMFDLGMTKDENQQSTSNHTSGLYVLPAETDI